jgi:hypothetical protein
MTMSIETAEAAELLPAGQWVEDAEGNNWCLFQTHVMVHQWMWKAAKSQTYVSLDSIPYPLGLCDLTENEGFVCPHTRTQECGHCTRCGAVVGDTEMWRSMVFGSFPISIGRQSGESQDRPAGVEE